MTKPRMRAITAFLLAGACAVSLAGCGSTKAALPFELPFELPDFSSIELPFQPTSIEEAEAARIAANQPQISSPAIIADGYLTVGIMSNSVR